jgi:hypothetical protein
MAFQGYAQRLQLRWQGCDWISQGRASARQNQTSQ